jgi:hypothetical protein
MPLMEYTVVNSEFFVIAGAGASQHRPGLPRLVVVLMVLLVVMVVVPGVLTELAAGGHSGGIGLFAADPYP